jgi:uncharacterized protein
VRPDIEKDIREAAVDILASKRFAKAKTLVHHNKKRNIAIHSLETAGYALMMARWLERHGVSVNETDVIRASLLHDIGMTEDEVYLSPSPIKAFSHPREGARIAQQEFGANETQVDAVAHHMWPIGLVPPHSLEGWIVVEADKCCSIREARHLAATIFRHLKDRATQ